jgi:hypothetical protein
MLTPRGDSPFCEILFERLKLAPFVLVVAVIRSPILSESRGNCARDHEPYRVASMSSGVQLRSNQGSSGPYSRKIANQPRPGTVPIQLFSLPGSGSGANQVDHRASAASCANGDARGGAPARAQMSVARTSCSYRARYLAPWRHALRRTKRSFPSTLGLGRDLKRQREVFFDAQLKG